MKLDSEIKKEVSELASETEKRFGVKCIVVNNKYRIPFAGMRFTFSLILIPLHGEDEENFNSKAEKFSNEYHMNMLMTCRTWHCYISFLYDTRPWFSRFSDKKEEFPLKSMAAGADLISPVIYGSEQMSKLRKEAVDFFGEGIIKSWKEEVRRGKKERDRKHKTLCRQENAYRKERVRLLNKYELHELKEVVLFISEKCKKESIYFVVALDGSGRPIGKALEWHGISCPVVYLDPRHMRGVDFENSDNRAWVLKAMEEEFPEVCQVLSVDPQRVLFVDDQTGYGGTRLALVSLVEIFSKSNAASLLNYMAMTPYMGTNTPSWLRKRAIQGIEIAPAESLRANDAPTAQSRRFYNRLKRVVLSW